MNANPTPRPHPHRSTHLLLLALLPLALFVSGCAHTKLVRVHDVYRAEFQQQLEPSATPTPAEFTFPNTLAAIQTFRDEHPTRHDALKHLAVLEAMVQLQSGNYGLAKATAAQADAMPGSLIDRNRKLKRDALFLEALRLEPGLIEAFQMIHGDLPKDEERLEQCGRGLAGLARNHQGIKEDDGAIYIAAVAANCFLHAIKQAALLTTGTKEERERLRREAELKHGAAAMEAMAPHLTESEMNADHAELKRLATESSRYRYVRLYHLAMHMRDRNAPNS
jgi:hypothetical protein